MLVLGVPKLGKITEVGVKWNKLFLTCRGNDSRHSYTSWCAAQDDELPLHGVLAGLLVCRRGHSLHFFVQRISNATVKCDSCHDANFLVAGDSRGCEDRIDILTHLGFQSTLPCLICCVHKQPGPRLNIKTVLSTYGDFHVKDKTAVRTSYL